MNSKKLRSLVILLIFLVASCGNPTSSNQNPIIEIQITGSESKELATETIPQPNCTGTAEVANTVQKSRTIQYVIEVQNETSVNANGQIGFAGTDVELGAAVANHFGQSYGTSESISRSITVMAGIGTDMQHTIRQVEIWKVGQAKISVGGQETVIPFKFRSDFAIELANSQDLKDCSTPNTENTASPAVTQAPSSTNYDDFNDPRYDNSINTSLWKTIQNPNCDIKQENGTAVFRLNDLSANRTLCYLEFPKYVEFNRVGYIESKLLAKNDASGDMSLGIIEFKTTGFAPDTDWIAQCGIIRTPKENKVELFLYVDNSFPNGQETYQTITASTEEFYKMRLEMNPDTGSIQCYANDKIVGSHNPTNVNALKTQLFNRHFVGFWSPQSAGTYQIDDVVALP